MSIDATHVFFYGNSSPFSQWHPCHFAEDGIVFSSAEQYMMYHKARLFDDDTTARAILATDDCARIKALGRRVRNFSESAWNANCLTIVTRGNVLKFSQDPVLQTILLATGTKTLVEASPKDAIWGIGLTEQQARQIHPRDWPGQNRLGVCLMNARTTLRGSSTTFADGTLVHPGSGAANISKQIDMATVSLAWIKHADVPDDSFTRLWM